MNVRTILHCGIATVLCLGLSGCLSTSGSNGAAGGGATAGGGTSGGGTAGGGTAGGGTSGGGTAGGGTAASGDFDANHARVYLLGAQSVRQTGVIPYAGKARIITSNTDGGPETGRFVGDLNITANFDAQTVSGTASNFTGARDGTARTLSGTLSTENSTKSNFVVQTTVPGVGTSANLMTNMRGNLTDPVKSQTASVDLSVFGKSLGANGEAFGGETSAIIADSTKLDFVLSGAGTFYLDKK